jgi:predicted N-acyltransferase
MGGDLALTIHDRIAHVPEAAWDALLGEDATPFVRWAFIEVLEQTGCATPETGWRPRHLTLHREGQLVAAAPAYLRSDSDGDFSRDWGWAAAIERAGIAYYPKLILSVPFSPCTGRRLLVHPGEDRAACVAALAQAASAVADAEGASSVHVLFPLESELEELVALGFLRRLDVQCHFLRRGLSDTDAWLAQLSAKKRHQFRREMAAPAAQGIHLRTVTGDELGAAPERWAREVHALYRTTVDKYMWGRPWLREAFFARLFQRMPDATEVVLAEREGRIVAGAFNIRGAKRLYGRYWGAHEEHPFLHFNVCLYHSIASCIERGIDVFEGGAGGGHKLARDFDLAPTYSAHRFRHPGLDHSLRGYLAAEWAERSAELAAWRSSRRPGPTVPQIV